MKFFDVAIIGLGRLGGALALALANKGYQVRELVARDKTKAEKIAQLISPKPLIYSEKELEKISSGAVFVTTRDDEIGIVANELSAKLQNLPYIFHTSGSHSSDVLSPLREDGCEVASFHPLASFSDPFGSVNNFEDSFICIEGDSEAAAIAEQIAKNLGGKPFCIKPKHKTLYHASAVMACGHLVALLSSSIEILTKCGMDENRAKEILLPLVKSTINNLSSQTPAESLTGTFARADSQTLQAHLTALRENVSSEILRVYISLGRQSLRIAALNGVDEQLINKMRDLLAECELACV